MECPSERKKKVGLSLAESASFYTVRWDDATGMLQLPRIRATSEKQPPTSLSTLSSETLYLILQFLTVCQYPFN